MRTIETVVYKFEDLPEEAQEKAIEKNYDLNTEYDWWESVYDDAERVELKITGFDLDRADYCNGKFIYTAKDTAEAIIKEHGEAYETYKMAKIFLDEYTPLAAKLEKAKDIDYKYGHRRCLTDLIDNIENAIEDMIDDFLGNILHDYKIMLGKEYEYLTSADAIAETLIANEYEFTIDGVMI